MTAHSQFLQRKSLQAARALLLGGVGALGDEEIEAGDADGRICAQPVVARHPSPHYRASAMDGIAVRAADTLAASGAPLLLRVLAMTDPAPPAGQPCCVPVDTGSLLPDWTDAVVRIEETSAAGGGYRIKAAVAPGRDVRRAGEDIGQGELLLPDGARIRPWDIGAMLATGATRVRVRRRPRIAILATGSEVVEPQPAAAAGSVIDYNSRMIAARVEEWGGSAHRLGIVADEQGRLLAAIEDAAARFDAVCVIAGSSAGRKDFTIAALAAAGDVLAHGVDISPGHPVALARLRRGNEDGTTPAIAVPGYPVSAIVVCEQLLAPLVAALLGTAAQPPATVRARLLRKIPSRLGMEEFRRVCLVRQKQGTPVAAPLPSAAGSISSVSGAHGWLRTAPEVEGLDAGSEVDVELLVGAADVDAAFVVAGRPAPATAALESRLRGNDALARVVHLRLGDIDALQAVERGEAHAAVIGEKAALPPGLRSIDVAGVGAVLAVLAGSHGEDVLAALEPGAAPSPAHDSSKDRTQRHADVLRKGTL